jgi:hypothetical protein
MSQRRATDENASEALPGYTWSGLPAWQTDGAVSFTVRAMTEETILASADVDVIGPQCPEHYGQQG